MVYHVSGISAMAIAKMADAPSKIATSKRELKLEAMMDAPTRQRQKERSRRNLFKILKKYSRLKKIVSLKRSKKGW